MVLKLTKNEKKVLKYLLGDARISDSTIAEKLKISSQAVGKIRKKLEGSVINSYTLNLDYSKIGVNIFAMAISKLTPQGLDNGELDIERKLLDEQNIIQVYRLPSGNATHVILYGFQDMNELDSFFHSAKNKNNIHKFIENKDLFTFSHNSLIKNNPSQLFNKMIDKLGEENKNMIFGELENFKRKNGY